MLSIFLFRHTTQYRNTEIEPSIYVFHLNLPPIGKNQKQEVNFLILYFVTGIFYDAVAVPTLPHDAAVETRGTVGSIEGSV